jgi:hypothetical protein
MPLSGYSFKCLSVSKNHFLKKMEKPSFEFPNWFEQALQEDLGKKEKKKGVKTISIRKPCPHGKKQKSYCIDCNGSRICPHLKQKAHCKECKGNAYCDHGKRKNDCRPCGGTSFCEHDKQKKYCVQCGGSGLCFHGIRKSRCKLC